MTLQRQNQIAQLHVMPHLEVTPLPFDEAANPVRQPCHTYLYSCILKLGLQITLASPPLLANTYFVTSFPTIRPTVGLEANHHQIHHGVTHLTQTPSHARPW